MKEIRLFTVLGLLLALVMVSYVSADQAGVVAKLSEAAKAEKPADASKAVEDAAAMVEKDTTGSGDYGEAVGRAVVHKLKELATTYAGNAKQAQVAAEIAQCRVKDLYGALLPAAKGDLAAAATYVKGLAAGAVDPAKEQIDAAVKALAGEDKDLAVRSMKVAVTAAYISKAYNLVAEKNMRQAGRWVEEAADYLKTEAGLSADRGEDIQDASALVRSQVPDLSANIPVEQEEIKGLFKTVEHGLMGPTKPKAAE